MGTWIKNNNHHFCYKIEINNSQEKIWDLLINVAQWKDWDTEIKEAKLFGHFELGAKGELIPKTGPNLQFQITEIIPEVSYTFKTKMPVGYLEIRRSLAVANGMTSFTDDIQFTGWLKRIFGLLLGRSFIKVLPEVMNNFKALAEGMKT